MSERAQILVIGDEPHARLISVRLLEGAGHAVSEVTTGEEGLRLARELRPDLILLDVVLPDLDGFEVCRRMKADPDLAHVLVILHSGKRGASDARNDSDSLAEGLEGGANGYILRGTPTREFVARIEAWLRIQRIEQELRLQTHELNERVKELHCLFEISRLIERPGISLPEILQGTVELLPAAWQYPEVACARIVLEGQEFRTADFAVDAPWQQATEIHLHGRPRGRVEVCYLECRPESDEGPFLKEERDLLNAIAERLGRIVERMQAEEALRWNQVIVSSISDPISYVDRDYVYRAVNETYCQYARRPAHEIVGLTVAELLGLEAFQDAVRPHLDRCFAGNEVHYQAWFDVPEQPRKYMDVGYYPVSDGQGDVMGAVVNSRDITERKQAEEALRRERDLVARIMETSPVGIVVVDRQGHITFVNAQVEQVTGLTREQIVQLNYNDPTWQMVDEAGQPLPDDLLPFPRLMHSAEPIYDLQQVVELPLVRSGRASSGPRRLHLSMNAAPFYDAAGEIDGVVITVQDVTERERLRQQIENHAAELEQRVAERTAELEASQAALLRAERLAIAGKLAASLTHEISNPLQSVIGCLGLAEETLDEGGDVREYLDVALPELRRVARIVARLRDLGRPPSPLSSREPTGVGALMEQVQALVRKQCQDKGITLDWRAPPDLPQIHVVPDQIQQVFLNLMLNAIEAMPVAAQGDGEQRIDVRARRTRAPDGVRITFRDSGTGISDDALPHVFDPFYSTKSEGLGLGLSISQEIVEQHGGWIEGESELGHGATFTVWLPVT